MKVIAISGKAQNGKDTTASILKEELESKGQRVLITHYADLVKYICTKFFGWDGIKDEKGRYLLQYVGTDVVRAQNPNYWVDFIVSVLNLFKDEWDWVLIPDTRFPNEIGGLKAAGFNTTHIRVVRHNLVSPLTKAQQNHPSETSLDNYGCDYELSNDGTYEDLKNNIKTLLKEIEAYD